MRIVTIIRRNIRQRLARNLALILSVALAAGLTTVFFAGREFFRSFDLARARPLIISEPLYPYGTFMRDADLSKVQGVPHVATVARSYIFLIKTPDGGYTPVSANDGTYFTVFNADGVWFRTDDEMNKRWENDRTAFIVGELTAQRMGFEVGKQYVVQSTSGPLTLNCVGISHGGANKVNLIVHWDYANEALFKRDGRVSRFLVAADSMANMDSVMTAIDALFKSTPTPTASVPAGEHLQASNGKQRSIVSMLGIVCVLIFFVTMFITLNTVLFLVRERRQVLAAMRAIGFRSGHVFALVAAEVIALCLIGGALGVGLTVLYFRGGIPFGQGNLTVTIYPGAIAAGLGATVLISIGASIIPSWLASRIDILSALRST